MRISASIYSDKKRDLETTIHDLKAHNVDLLHVDCNDNLAVFDDIKKIRSWCDLPIDLHIITPNPSKYYDLLRENPVEFITFQYEDLNEKLEIPSDISGKKGLGIITPTNVSVFKEFPNFDFLLVMATIPGQSGGVFDPINFSKIRQFQKEFPSKNVHVDGGVNGEVSFILRNMGVHSSVSGSFLFNAPSVGHALMDLTKRNNASKFLVKDFMIPLAESPKVIENASIQEILENIEIGKLGFTLVMNQSEELIGLISNADVRKSLIKNSGNISSLSVNEIMNATPIKILDTSKVDQLFELIDSYTFPLLYLPVVNSEGKAKGIVTFVHLIKGEI